MDLKYLNEYCLSYRGIEVIQMGFSAPNSRFYQLYIQSIEFVRMEKQFTISTYTIESTMEEVDGKTIRNMDEQKACSNFKNKRQRSEVSKIN